MKLLRHVSAIETSLARIGKEARPVTKRQLHRITGNIYMYVRPL